MQLAQLSTRYPPGPGGVERHVHEVSRRLAARGHAVGVYTSELYREFPWQRLDPAVPRSAREDGVQVHRLPVWSLPGELHYPFFRGLGRALERDRPELLHAHTFGTHHVTVAGRFAVRTGRPLVVSAHFHPIWSIEGGWMRHALRAFYDRALSGRLLRRARAVVVQSAEEERLLRSVVPRLPPVRRIAPGYTTLPEPPPGAAPFARWAGVDGPFALFVGRLASNKGLIELVQAFAALAHYDPSARLVVVGEDGGMRATIEQAVRRDGLEGRVHLTGFVADERLLAAAFREARLFVLPSAYEAYGLVLLEALAQGTPVIASRVGGIPEFIEDRKSGRLVPPGSPAALANALVELWNDPALARSLGETGRREVLPRHSWDRVTDDLEALYSEVRRR